MSEQRARSGRRGACWIALAATTALAGCGARFNPLDPGAVSVRGVNPSLESLQVAGVAERQDTLVTGLQKMAGLTDTKADGAWFLIVKAGMEFEGGQCDEYLDALFKFDREQRALHQGIAATGAAAATIMGLSATPAAPIAATAAAFGLATTLFDARANTVLFQLAPSGVRNIVVQAEDAYRDSVTRHPDLYKSRPDALLALQGYLRLCTPAAIESAVNQAAATTQFSAKEPTAQDPAPSLQQTSTAPPAIQLGSLGVADKAAFDAADAMRKHLAALSNRQILVMARQMLPTWNGTGTDPKLASLHANAALADWQSDPGHARALMLSWLLAGSGPLAPWEAAFDAALATPK